MNKFTKLLGVTLLEVMLVLAVASIVILTSVRFYKSATEGSQVNSIIGTIQAIVAASDGLAQNTGSYTAATNTAVSAVVGSSAMVAPWGAAISITSSTATTVVIGISAAPSTSVCTQMTTKLQLNPKLAVNGTCTSITYTSNN